MVSSIPLPEIETLWHLQTTTYLDVASSAMLIYDYFLTLDNEVKFVWKGKWSAINLVFFMTRYLPFIDTVGASSVYHLATGLPIETCSALYKFGGYMFDVGMTAADLILISRTWAIFNHNKKVLAFLIVLILATWVPSTYFLQLHLNSVRFAPMPTANLPGCLLTEESPILFGSYVLLTVFETVVFVFTLVQAVRSYNKDHKSPLWATLYRDGLLFYFYLFAFSVFNVVMLTTSQDFAAWPHRVLHPVLSTRILLNLRVASSKRIYDSEIPSFSESQAAQLQTLEFRTE